MPTCYVPYCRSGYANNKEKTRFFKPPCDRTRFLWNKLVPRDGKMTKTSKICEKHFREEDMIKGEYLTIQGTKVLIPSFKWKLVPDAKPKLNLGKSFYSIMYLDE